MRSEAWRPAAAARNRSPLEARDPRPPGTTTWVRGARCNRSGANAGEASADPEPKIATVERREASVPRHGKLQSDGALCDLMGQKRLIDAAQCCTLAPDRAWCYFTPLFRTLTGRRSPSRCPSLAMLDSKA